MMVRGSVDKLCYNEKRNEVVFVPRGRGLPARSSRPAGSQCPSALPSTSATVYTDKPDRVDEVASSNTSLCTAAVAPRCWP
jgi:hypothetical protein